jgi:hypothetical protein
VNYFTVFTDVLLRPSEFFKKMPHEDNLLHALIFSIVFLFITVLTGHFFETIHLTKTIRIPGPIFVTEILQVSTISLFFILGLFYLSSFLEAKITGWILLKELHT